MDVQNVHVRKENHMARALDLNEIRSGLVSFVKEWDDAEGYERGEAQSFVRDLLSAFGITRSRATLYENGLSAPRPAARATSTLSSQV